MDTYIFFLNPSFQMIGLDQLKYWFGLVNISFDWLISVSIGYYRPRLVNFGQDGLIIKQY